MRCAGKDDLRPALAELATPIGFEFTDDEKKNADLQFERTRRELKKLADAREPHRCLLILDNVDQPGLLDPAQVARLNGGDWLHVLASTRLGENELHGAHRDRSFLAIDELPPDDAFALIESYQPERLFRSETERDAAREIVRLLGSFTLAVESAAVYLGRFANDVTCAAFLSRLTKEGLEGLDTAASQSSEGVMHGEKRLGATLRPTLERLGAAEKLALEFAAMLPPDQVPLPWLRALVAKTFPEMERDAEPGHPDPWKNVQRRLCSLRLIQATNVFGENGQPRVVRVHRLVQQLTEMNSLHSKIFECEKSLFTMLTGLSTGIPRFHLQEFSTSGLEFASFAGAAEVSATCTPKVRRLLLHREVRLIFDAGLRYSTTNTCDARTPPDLYSDWLGARQSRSRRSRAFLDRWAHMEYDLSDPVERSSFNEERAIFSPDVDFAMPNLLALISAKDKAEGWRYFRGFLQQFVGQTSCAEFLAMAYSCLASVETQMGNSAAATAASNKASQAWESHFGTIK